MSKIHAIPVTAEMETILLKLLDNLPSASVVGLGNHLAGGFRDPRLIRERMKAILQGDGSLPAWLLAEIKSSLPVCTGVSALSVEALREQFDILLMAAGPSHFLLALAADERPDVQKLALERLTDASEVISDEDRDAATDLWMKSVDATFVQFTGLRITPPEDETDESPIHQEDAKRLEKENIHQAQLIADLKTKLEKERAAYAEDRRRLTASAKAERERLTEAIKKLEHQITELSSQKNALEQRNHDLEKGKNDSISAAVRAELASIERKWLADAIALESVVADNSTAGILLRVESVLKEQRKKDRHSGNRLVLQQRLKELREAGHELRDVRQNALHPIRDLAMVADLVAHEIARIESQLGISAPDGIAERLLPQINESVNFSVLQEYGGLVDSLVSRGIISQDQSCQFYEALQRRLAVLAVQSKTTGDESNHPLPSFPSFLHRNLDCFLLLDGHNILFALDHLQACFQNGKPGNKALNRLEEVTRKLVATRTNVNAHIFFDGPNYSVSTPCPNLKVEFSGGRGGDRADHAIVRHLKRKEVREHRQPIFVVTNDRTLKAFVEHLHARCMSVGAFDVTLRNFNCLA